MPSDTPANSPFDTLPDEVLMQIFHELTNRELKIATFVCNRWAGIIIEAFGHSLYAKMLRFAKQDAKKLIDEKQRELSELNQLIQPNIQQEFGPEEIFSFLLLTVMLSKVASLLNLQKNFGNIALLTLPCIIGIACLLFIKIARFNVRIIKRRNISQTAIDKLNAWYRSTIQDIPWLIDSNIKQVIDNPGTTSFNNLEEHAKQDIDSFTSYSQQLDEFISTLRGRNLSTVPIETIPHTHLKTYLNARLLFWNKEHTDNAFMVTSASSTLKKD